MLFPQISPTATSLSLGILPLIPFCELRFVLLSDEQGRCPRAPEKLDLCSCSSLKRPVNLVDVPGNGCPQLSERCLLQ